MAEPSPRRHPREGLEATERKATVGTARIRPATLADVPAIAAIAAACEEPIDTPGRPGFPYGEHLVRRATVLVAQLDESIAAYAALVDLGSSVHLSDLFVEPARQGRGLGSLLLAAILPRGVPATTFSSGDPRALPLYVRAGLGAWWPNLYLRGETSGLPWTGLELAPVGLEEASSLETALEPGSDRRADHAYWASLPGGCAFALSERGKPAALGVAVDGRSPGVRRLVRLVAARTADPVAVVLAALRAAAQAGLVRLTIPGPHPALPVLLRAGFRLVDRDTFMASAPDLVDARRSLPDPSFR